MPEVMRELIEKPVMESNNEPQESLSQERNY